MNAIKAAYLDRGRVKTTVMQACWNDGNNMEGHSHVPFILRWFLVRSTASTDCTRALEPDLRRSELLSCACGRNSGAVVRSSVP